MRFKAALIMTGLILIAFASVSFAADKQYIQEGLWEITTTIKMEGMPAGMAPRTVTAKQCLTNDKLVPENQDKKNDCKTKLNTTANTMDMTVQCVGNDGGRTDTVMKVTYKGRTEYDGTSDTTITPGNKSKRREAPMSMHSTMKGRYVGECPPTK